MNTAYSELLLRFMPLLQVLGGLIMLSVPVALFLIWNELAKVNEHLRIQQVLDDARASDSRK